MADGTVTIDNATLDGVEDELRALLGTYFADANARGREWFDDWAFGADVNEIVEDDLRRLEAATFEKPLYLARHGGRIVGTVQVKKLDDTTLEVKRLYVRPAARGEGVGRRLVEALIENATEAGYDALRLGVAPYHETARSLYESLGFEPTPPYDGTGAPTSIHDDWTFMKRSLRG